MDRVEVRKKEKEKKREKKKLDAGTLVMQEDKLVGLHVPKLKFASLDN